LNLNVGIRGLTSTTNILDINVPKELEKRVKTGVKYFDDAVGGQGFCPSSVMMLTGTPGAGKTTMLLQLADAITGQGNVCLYNTGEESLYQVRMVTKRLKVKNGFIAGQHSMVGDLLLHADELRKANKSKQVFILQDSLQTLNDGKYKDGGTTGNTPLRCTELLTDWAKQYFGIVVFIGQVTKSGDFSGKNGILHAIDVRGQLYYDDDKKSDTYGERIFEITKNRFGCSGRAYVVGMGDSGLYEKGSFNMNSSIGGDKEDA
jgi:DNA repair protein RadA/Sms